MNIEKEIREIKRLAERGEEAQGGHPAIEMPCAIVAMENVAGRLIVVLEDGRTVDMTDMFHGEARQ